VTATTKINRRDWWLTWNQALEVGGVLVGDVAITLDIENGEDGHGGPDERELKSRS